MFLCRHTRDCIFPRCIGQLRGTQSCILAIIIQIVIIGFIWTTVAVRRSIIGSRAVSIDNCGMGNVLHSFMLCYTCLPTTSLVRLIHFHSSLFTINGMAEQVERTSGHKLLIDDMQRFRRRELISKGNYGLKVAIKIKIQSGVVWLQHP